MSESANQKSSVFEACEFIDVLYAVSPARAARFFEEQKQNAEKT